MPSFNKCILAGHLTRDPDVRYTSNGKAVAGCGIAMNEKRGGEERAVFVDLDLWEQQAEFAGKYCKKGDAVLVEGRLTLDTWQDRQTGANRSKLKVTVDRLQSLQPRETPPTTADAEQAATECQGDRAVDVAEDEGMPF